MTPSVILHIVEAGIVILLLVQCYIFFETRAHVQHLAKTSQRVDAVEVTAVNLQQQVHEQRQAVSALLDRPPPGPQRSDHSSRTTSGAQPPMRGAPTPGPIYDPKAK